MPARWDGRIDQSTLLGVGPLLHPAVHDTQWLARWQDDALGRMFMDRSAVPLPAQAADLCFSGFPMDMLLYEHEGATRALVLETNGRGWAMTGVAPPCLRDALYSSNVRAGRRLAAEGDSGLAIVVASGRDVPDTAHPSGLKQSPWVLEKVADADQMAGPLREGRRHVQILAFDPSRTALFQDPAWLRAPTPTIVVGYLPELLKCPQLQARNGRMFLFGRPVHVVLNDRFVSQFEAARHCRVDPRMTCLLNPLAHLATSKAATCEAANAFNAERGRPFALCNRPIMFTECRSADEVVAAVQQLQARGLPAILKPENTGGGIGIRVLDTPILSPQAIRSALADSLEQVNQRFNGPAGHEVAGFPYTVTEFKRARQARFPHDSPWAHATGYRVEVRIGLVARYAGRRGDLVALPQFAKLQAPGSIVGNLTSQTAGGRRPEDFVLPLCHRELLSCVGLTLDDALQLCRWVSHYARFVLSRPGYYGGRMANFAHPRRSLNVA